MSLELLAGVNGTPVDTTKLDRVESIPRSGKCGRTILKSGLLFSAQNIPLPLRGNVKLELKQMQSSLGIISRVDTPTQWCVGMVVM
jgi:hypothetical protein